MNFIQKNVFGDNLIYTVSPNFSRQLTSELKEEIIFLLNTFNATSVSIRFEHGSETAEFATLVAQFLTNNKFNVYKNEVMMSEIKRNEFSIKQHPSDSGFAIIKIGSIL
ncbi:MAG: hypothetical protein JST75_20445 [Bacteroidetes bacterium]|nr:hypothetical protein [Bacteroidota bacterium]